MKPLHWFIEPETRDRYVRDQEPSLPLLPIARYTRIGDFYPPKNWNEFNPQWEHWDPFFQKAFLPEYEAKSRIEPEAPVTISVQAKMMAKSYARKNGLRGVGNTGVIFWSWFPRVPPCWLVITHTQAYKMLTEQEAGMLH